MSGEEIIIAGSRDISLPVDVLDALICALYEVDQIGTVLCGCCRGMDESGRLWAESRGIAVRRFPADWEKHGRAAGPIRNAEMVRAADCALVIAYEDSRGSRNLEALCDGIGVGVLAMWFGRGLDSRRIAAEVMRIAEVAAGDEVQP